MNALVRILVGKARSTGSFEGTAGEERVYARACRLWRAAGFRVKNEKFVTSTLGARAERSRKGLAAASILLLALVGCTDTTSPTEPRALVVTATPTPTPRPPVPCPPGWTYDPPMGCFQPMPPTPTPGGHA